MSVTAITAITEGNDARTQARRRARRRPHLPPPDPGPEAVVVTISLDLSAVADRERVLGALRDLVAAGGGQEASVLVPPASPPPDASRPAERPLEIRPGTRTVLRAGTPIRLSRLEYDLLLFFVRHPDRVFTRHQLLTHVWGHTFAGSRTVDVHIRRLRMKLELERPLVTTVHGIGYRLADDPPVRLVDA
jgi:DNA-binding response OmpR family regulator